MSLQAELHRAHVERLRKFFPPKPVPRPVTRALQQPQEEPHQTTQQHHSDVKQAPVPSSEPQQMPLKAQVGALLCPPEILDPEGCLFDWMAPPKPKRRSSITASMIIDLTCEQVGIPRKLLLSNRREKKYVEGRAVAIYLCYKHTTLSFPQIGKLFHRDHTTVLHANQKMEKLIRDGHEIVLLVKNIIRRYPHDSHRLGMLPLPLVEYSP